MRMDKLCRMENLPVEFEACPQSTITISDFDTSKCKYNRKGKCSKDKKDCKVYKVELRRKED